MYTLHLHIERIIDLFSNLSSATYLVLSKEPSWILAILIFYEYLEKITSEGKCLVTSERKCLLKK
jgi:hypothetical protein